MISIYLLLDYRVLGSYAFDMCLFMAYLQHICDTTKK